MDSWARARYTGARRDPSGVGRQARRTSCGTAAIHSDSLTEDHASGFAAPSSVTVHSASGGAESAPASPRVGPEMATGCSPEDVKGVVPDPLDLGIEGEHQTSFGGR